MCYYYKSPFGNIEFCIRNEKLVSLKFCNESYPEKSESNFAQNIKTQLEEYFSGKRTQFDIPYTLSGSDFQKRVWAELLKIPYGKTKSYEEIAVSIGNPNAQRAVGSACNKNPIAIIIPCHRVIAKSGNLSGYAFGLKVKNKLLRHENHSK